MLSLDASSQKSLNQTGGEITVWPPFSLSVSSVWLWCGHRDDLRGVFGNHVGARNCGEEEG